MSRQGRSISARFVVAIAAAAVLIAPCSPALAFSGSEDRLPATSASAGSQGLPFSPQSGLAIDVDSRWFNDHGYRPFRVVVTAAAPRPADRQVTFELSIADSSARGMRTAPASVIRRAATLAAGESRVEFTVPCPPGVWSFVWWSTRVDGEVDPHLSVSRGAARSLGGGQSATLNVLRDASPAADGRTGRALSYRGLGFVVDETTTPLSDDPLAYTGADIVRISWPQLRRIVEERRPTLEALRSWVLTGGSLWIELCGDDEATFAEIDDALSITAWRFRATEAERQSDPLPAKPVPASSPSVGPNGAAPDPAAKTPIATPVKGHDGWVYPKLSLDDESDPDASEDDEQPSQDSRGWFAERRTGFGMVVAFPRRFIDVPTRLILVGPSAAAKRWTDRAWAWRHGLEADGMSSEFGRLLAEGVGVAPVVEFQVLITLFVIVVGPLNYWLLWRRQQLNLLVLTAPLIAAVATIGLFAYALFSDGFGVIERVRSVTLLDQATGEAAWWARATHHGGAAQRRPAVVPQGVAAYPIRPVWESAVVGAGGSLTTDVTPDGVRRHSAGWLPSRSAVQHLLVGQQPFNGKLTFRGEPNAEGDQTGPTWSVSNRLGVELSLLLARAGEGWMVAENVAPGAAVTLTPLDRLDATQRLRIAALDNEPTFPIGAGFSVEQTLERLGSRGALRRMQNSVARVSLADNLLNRRLGSLSGLDGGRPLDLPPRSYVAVSEQSVTVPALIEGAEQREGFHVVVGRW